MSGFGAPGAVDPMKNPVKRLYICPDCLRQHGAKYDANDDVVHSVGLCALCGKAAKRVACERVY